MCYNFYKFLDKEAPLIIKQEQVLVVIALLLFSGILVLEVLSSPLRYEVTVEDGPTEAVVESTTVPSVSETVPVAPETLTSSETVSEPATSEPVASGGIDAFGRVNLNTATKEELESLPGIGSSKAEAILQDRQENGPFASSEELTRVSGIGQKTLESLRSYIIV